jgi:hypothetical protein
LSMSISRWISINSSAESESNWLTLNRLFRNSPCQQAANELGSSNERKMLDAPVSGDRGRSLHGYGLEITVNMEFM